MKKIYEDGADRPQIEDISSGAFDFTDADPLPQKRATPQSPIRTNNPDAAQEAANAEPTVQMTQEQLEQLLQKVLAVASGKEVRAEANGFHDLAIFKTGVTL